MNLKLQIFLITHSKHGSLSEVSTRVIMNLCTFYHINVQCSVFQIDTYETVYEEAEQIKATMVFDTWFKVDSKPFKQALLNTIKRWSFMFKQHLIDHVTNRYLVFFNFAYHSYPTD